MQTVSEPQVSTGPGQAGAPARAGRTDAAYGRVEELLAAERCVILDGGTGTELGRRLPAAERGHEEALWGTWSLMRTPEAVRDVHRSYLEVGCDVISTNTWGLSPEMDGTEQPPHFAPLHWMDVARRGIQVGREAIDQAGRRGEVALAFSIHGEVTNDGRMEFLELLPRAFERERPDLILLETIMLIRDGFTFDAIERLVQTGVPVWTSFRRCRHGVCGVYGQHWGGPEGDEFGRAARRLEEIGVRALLINCLPPDHVSGMLPWLRDFTDLPLGVYPNLGYCTAEGWSFDKTVDGPEYAELAGGWREQGAQIIGGCCGVRPEHIGAAAELVRKPRRKRRHGSPAPRREATVVALDHAPEQARRPWLDEQGRQLFPLELPEIVCEPGVFVPTQGSFLVWKHLFRERIGAGLRCLDVGCGTGLLATQLALNGAEHVHAIDIDSSAVANALSNAFRNGTSDLTTGEAVDLYGWVPKERYDLVAASLYQMPVDPYEQPNSHRPLDFWGRNLVDHLIALLPDLLAPDGVAYLMQLSILGQSHTQDVLAEAGFDSRVVDFAFFNFHELFEQRLEQIERVEELCDAYHLRFADEHVMVAYLLEVTRANSDE